MSQKTARLVQVLVSVEFLQAMFTAGWCTYFVCCTEGLPTGAEFCHMLPGPDANSLGLVFSHPTFAEVEHGQELPKIRPVFKKYATADDYQGAMGTK